MKKPTSRKPGRPSKYRSPEARKAAQRKTFQRWNTTVRKVRYAKDPDYREAILDQQRKIYAAKTEGFEPLDFGANSGKADEFAATFGKAGEPQVHGLSRAAMARFLGLQSAQVLYLWIRHGKFPAPTIPVGSPPWLHVYSIRLANKYCTILHANISGRGSFRETDVETIQQLHAVK